MGYPFRLRKTGQLVKKKTATGNRKVSKKVQAARLLYFTLRLWQIRVCGEIGQDLAHLGYRSIQDDWNIFEIVKSWRWVQVGFIHKMRYDLANCRACHGVTNLVL
jgi:hypothetical protein